MTTKVPAELSSTPSIVDNGNSTAVTIDSSERVGILQSSPTSNLHIGASGNDAKRELRIDGTIGSGQTYGCIIEADGENGRFVFKVGQSGNTPAQQFMVHPDGGICFGSDTAAANALDDYETGTWTPAFQGATGIAYSEQTGYYIKIGDQVTLSFRMNVTTAPTSGSNIYIIMPYNPKGTATGVAGTRWSLCTGTTLSDSVAALTGIANYASVANFYQYNSKNGSGYFNYTHFGTGLYSATLTYRID